MVRSYGTGKVSDTQLTAAVRKVFDLTPRGIISRLDLRKPIFKRTAAYGHFGREEGGFTWERTDMVAELQRAVG
jgi:S-adenosylmethionine synthetase